MDLVCLRNARQQVFVHLSHRLVCDGFSRGSQLYTIHPVVDSIAKYNSSHSQQTFSEYMELDESSSPETEHKRQVQILPLKPCSSKK